MDYSNELAAFIRTELLHGRSVNFDADQDLLSAGIIDSLGILRLVAFMEDQLGIQVLDEDVVFENFSSIKVMNDYVCGRLAATR